MVETATKRKEALHPSGDKRFKLLEVTMKRHQFRSDSLIEELHAAHHYEVQNARIPGGFLGLSLRAQQASVILTGR